MHVGGSAATVASPLLDASSNSPVVTIKNVSKYYQLLYLCSVCAKSPQEVLVWWLRAGALGCDCLEMNPSACNLQEH